MSRKEITAKQFLQLPLSEAVLWVIDDVKNMRKKHIQIKMSTYWDVEPGPSKPKLCSVCLAGACVVGFFDKKEVAGFAQSKLMLESESFIVNTLGINFKELNFKMQHTFNDIRRSLYCEAFKSWYFKFKYHHIILDEIENDENIQYHKYVPREYDAVLFALKNLEDVHLGIDDDAFLGRTPEKSIDVLIEQMQELSHTLKKFGF